MRRLSFVILAAPTLLCAQSSQPPTIIALGSGELRLPPASASVSLAVESKAATASAAATANAASTAAVLAALRRIGFGQHEVSTASYTVGPNTEYDRNGPVWRGYQATNSVVVTVHAFSKLPMVIDSAIAQGATRVSDVRFYVANPDSAHDAALKSAVAKARHEAETMATAAGGRLGELVEVSNVANATLQLRGASSVANTYYEVNVPGTSISAESVVVSAQVSTKWRYLTP